MAPHIPRRTCRLKQLSLRCRTVMSRRSITSMRDYSDSVRRQDPYTRRDRIAGRAVRVDLLELVVTRYRSLKRHVSLCRCAL